MKVFALVVALLCISSVRSLIKHPYRVWELTPNSIGANSHPRIYMGITAKEGQFPYMIFTLMHHPSGSISHCSASLINPSWVLLAAHCVLNNEGKRDYLHIIVVGGKADLNQYVRARILLNFDESIDEKAFGLQERRAKNYFSHPKYDPKNLDHDVALIQLNEPFHLSSIKTIPLSEDKMKQRKSCTILGWGLTLENKRNFRLNFAENKTVRTTEMGCDYTNYGSLICLYPGNSGICQGDSGSPLVCDGKVWGVASHFISNNEYPECGDSLEEYYSELYANLDWIKSVYTGGSPTSTTNFGSLLVCFLTILDFLRGGSK